MNILKPFSSLKRWFENTIFDALQKVMTDYWTQYANRMELNRRQREKKRKLQGKKDLRQKYKDAILLDTSALIDGRILEIYKTGFLVGPAIITKSVLNELHLLSDSKSDIKRKKGRNGLDLVPELKKYCRVHIINSPNNTKTVDESLLAVAKEYNMRLLTLDFNLMKLAQSGSVRALNLNDLILALKPNFIPGEELDIRILEKGKEKGQGIGYLDDGTMVIVSGGAKVIDTVQPVVVTKLIQSSAGKIIFADLKSSSR